MRSKVESMATCRLDYENESVVVNAYHTAKSKHLCIPTDGRRTCWPCTSAAGELNTTNPTGGQSGT